MKILSALLFAIIAFFISACASPEEQKAYVSRLSDQELCMSWMTSASMNQYQSARVGEINRRGLNCWKYGNVAEEQRKARADFDDAVRRASGQRQQVITNPQQNSRPAANPNSCIQDGGSLYCPNHPNTRLIQPSMR